MGARRLAQKEWDVVVVGSATTDFVVRAGELPDAGGAEEGDTFLDAVGGKGANLAVAAARLGARAAFVGCVGADARGERVVERLGAEGVDVRCVARDPDTATAAVVIHVDRHGQTRSVRAAGAAERLSWADVERARGLLRQARVVACVRTVPDAALQAAAEIARAAGAEVYLDVAMPRRPEDELLRACDLVRANAREAEVASGVRVSGERSAREAAEALRARGARTALVAASGGDGVLSTAGWQWLPKVDVEVVDTTGAGDAFGGALCAELACGTALEDAVVVANAAAALATTKLGGMDALPRREDVFRLRRELAERVR